MKNQLQQPEISQLHRLQGQLRGVEELINQKAKPEKILQQIEAVRGNLKALEKRILSQKIKNLKDLEIQPVLGYLLKISRQTIDLRSVIIISSLAVTLLFVC